MPTEIRRGAGYIANVSFWPWQNLQLAAQYTGYTRFNGGTTNYDGSGRNASANNTIYLDSNFFSDTLIATVATLFKGERSYEEHESIRFGVSW